MCSKKEKNNKICIEKIKELIKCWCFSANEGLYAKLEKLRVKLDALENDKNKEIIEKCKEKLESACKAVQPRFLKKYKFFWELVHSIDEDLILIIPEEELLAKAYEIKSRFSQKIKERSLRAEWLGDEGKKGKLTQAVEELEQLLSNCEQSSCQDKKILKIRHILKEALHLINQSTDTRFWQLSLNMSVVVLSSFLLLLFIFILILIFIFILFIKKWEFLEFWENWYKDIKTAWIPLAFFGAVGAYLSNIITKKDFLFIRGTYLRFFSYHIISKPIIGGVSGIFIYLLERSKLVFSLNISKNAPIVLNVPSTELPYAYAILAIVAGFAGDKLLKSMIEKVLKRLEEKAEKTKEISNN